MSLWRRRIVEWFSNRSCFNFSTDFVFQKLPAIVNLSAVQRKWMVEQVEVGRGVRVRSKIHADS